MIKTIIVIFIIYFKLCSLASAGLCVCVWLTGKLVLFQMSLHADWCSTIPGITWGDIHVKPGSGAQTETQIKLLLSGASDVMLPRRCFCGAQEGVAQLHSSNTLVGELWVLTVSNNPSHHKHTEHGPGYPQNLSQKHFPVNFLSKQILSGLFHDIIIAAIFSMYHQIFF